MAFEGNLTSFGLSEIMQMIAVQQKTGMLTVSAENITTVMFFRDGQIVSTRDRRRRTPDPFQEYLTRYGILTHEDIARITNISAQSKLDLLDVITSEALMSQEELHRHFHNQILEAMHDVLTWEQCTYKFVTSAELVNNVTVIGAFSVEAMLMESMRRIDEFPGLLEMFPSDQLLISPLEGNKAPDEMTKGERAILSLLSDVTSLRHLIAHAQRPLFEVYEALKLLREKRLIELRDARSRTTSENAGAQRGRARSGRFKNILPVGMAVALFVSALGTGAYGLRPSTPAQIKQDLTLQHPSILRAQLQEKLRWLLEAYRAQYGGYPKSLSALELSQLASPELIQQAEAFSLKYGLTKGRAAYTLR